jgi:hypothetical protein
MDQVLRLHSSKAVLWMLSRKPIGRNKLGAQPITLLLDTESGKLDTARYETIIQLRPPVASMSSNLRMLE